MQENDEVELITGGKDVTVALKELLIGNDRYDLTKFDTMQALNKEFKRTGKPYKFVSHGKE